MAHRAPCRPGVDAVRDQQGRHADPDVRRREGGDGPRGGPPCRPLRLRRFQHRADAGVQHADPRHRGARRGLGGRAPARRCRVRRGLAPRRHAGEEAERLRRPLRVRRGAVPGEGHPARPARRRRRVERRPPRRRGRHPAAGALPGRPEPGSACRNAEVPRLPHRSPLDGRVRGLRTTPRRSAGSTPTRRTTARAPGVPLPLRMLFATAESDSRVDPMHARKMAGTIAGIAGGERTGPSCSGSRAGPATGPESPSPSSSTRWSTSSPSCSTSSAPPDPLSGRTFSIELGSVP